MTDKYTCESCMNDCKLCNNAETCDKCNDKFYLFSDSDGEYSCEPCIDDNCLRCGV